MSLFSLRRVGFPSGARWTPAQSPPNFWFNPTESSLVLSGNNVITLNDFLGNGKSVSAPTSLQRAVRIQNGLGSKNIIKFDGVDDELSNISAGASGLTSVLVMAMMKYDTGDGAPDIAIGVGPGYNPGRMRTMYRTSNGALLSFTAWGADFSASAHALDIGTEFNLLGFWNTQLATPNNIRLMKNASITSHSTSTQTTLDGLSFGNLVNGGDVFAAAVSIAEAVVYYSLPSSDIIDRLMGYLAWEHGQQAKLPANFIYKNSPPYL